MVPGAASQVGERIAAARQRRGIARRTLADLIGRSEEWLRQIEKGQRRLDSIECAVRLADVLHVKDLLTELGLQAREGDRPVLDDAVLLPVRAALMDSVTTLAFSTPREAWEDAARTLDEDVSDAWGRWHGHADRYTSTVRVLPRLVRGAAVRVRDGATSGALAGALAAYHLARTVLSRMGDESLASMAADRAFGAAERDGTPELLGAAAWHVSTCYLRQGFLSASSQFATAAADHLPAADDAEILILWGALRLVAAEAAAGRLDTPSADRLLADAEQAAARLGADASAAFIPFGPTEVGINAVHIAIRQGRSSAALRLAAQVDIPDDYPADRQARHYLPLAYLHASRNEDAAAVFALNKVAAMSPEDIRYDSYGRRALLRLLRRNNLIVRRELGRLARLAGVS